jgi:YcaO cyclodehydratase, ATP-ad Mg2+-binding
MAMTYDDLIETRPRIRRDVLFTETPGGVLFHNAKGGFHINAKNAYRFTELMVPYLNGEHQVKEICEGFGDQQRSMLTTFLSSLFARDFARDVPVVDAVAIDRLGTAALAVFETQLSYVDHYADDAPGRFARFRQAAVAVVGSGPVAEQCVLGLVRNGAGIVGFAADLADQAGARQMELSRLDGVQCPVDERTLPAEEGLLSWDDLAGYDVVLVAGASAAAQLHCLETEGVPDGVVLLGAWVFGQRAIVGPMLTSETDALWTSAVLRLGANVSAADEAALWAGVASPGSAISTPDLQGPLAAMVGNLLAYECFRSLTGALRAETVGALIIQDINSLDVAVEPLFQHPSLAGGSATVPELVLPRRADQAPRTDRSTSHDQDPEALALNAKAVIVQLHTGIVTAFTDGPWTQTPLKVSSVLVNPTRSISREIVAVDLHHLAGARLRALEAAALVHVGYAAEVVGLLCGEALAAARAALPIIDSRELSISNGTESRVQAAVRGRVLGSGATVLIPADAVQPACAKGVRCTQVTSAGSGAAADAAQAVARGLGTALAHRALMLALRGSTTVTRLDATGLHPQTGAVGTPGEELRFLLRSAEIFELDVELLDLGESTRSGAHVVLARTTGEDPAWVISCGLDLVETARDALRDLLGGQQLRRESKPPSGGDPDAGDSLLADLDPRLVAITTDSTAGGITKDKDQGGHATEWDDVVSALHGEGIDPVFVMTTTPDLAIGGIETAKVLLWTRHGQR